MDIHNLVIDTEFGKVRIIGWSGKHIHVTSDLRPVDRNYLVVNNVPMTVALNLEADETGQFGMEPTSLLAQKLRYKDWRDMDASSNARRKIASVIPPLVIETLRKNPQFLLEAEIDAAQKDLTRQEEDIKTAQKELAEMRAKKRSHQQRIVKAQRQLEKITNG